MSFIITLSEFPLWLILLCPLLPYEYSYKASHPVPDRVKLSFVIFDIRALRAIWCSGLSVRVSGLAQDAL